MKSILFAASLLLSVSLSAQTVVKVGDKAPDFSAKDQTGKTVELKKVLRQGPAIVVFYRGNWCPNCSRSLKNIQDSLGQLTARKATVIAISPETPEGVAKTVKNTKATFSVLSDAGQTIARQYGVAFAVTPDMDEIHQKYGIDIAKNNGANGNNLNRPSAYVVRQDGTVSYVYFNANPYSNAKSNERVTVAQLVARLN